MTAPKTLTSSLPTVVSFDADSAAARRFGFAVAVVLAVMYFGWTHAAWVPLHVGVDQNGYLVGGKMFARTLETRQWPTVPGHPDQFDPHAFVANMWVRAANDPHAFDPKYPLGLPLIYAITMWLTAGGTTLAYLVSPLAMAASIPGIYLVVRRYGGVFGGILAVFGFATSPLIAYCVNNPNSHAVAIFCSAWGMAAVLRWWHGGARRWAVIGGLLVGYTTTVRYTEGLLILPLLWCCFVRSPERVVLHQAELAPLRRRHRIGAVLKRGIDPLCLLAAWAAPVGGLVAYNWFVLGTLTGYDSTNESTGFAWSYFFDNWETLVRNMGTLGLFFLMPLAIGGLVLMAWRTWRTAGVIWLWALPSVTLYAFYYWGPDGVGYIRFFATTLTPLLAAAMVPLRAADVAAVRVPRWRAAVRPVLAVAAGLGAAAVVFFGPRFEAETRKLLTVQDYLDRPPTSYQRTGGAASLLGGVVCAGAFAAAFAGGRRRDAAALAFGAMALVGVGASADASSASLEQSGYDTAMYYATETALRQAIPEGAMLICPEENILQYLQFVSDDRLYTGYSFDRGWVDSRPRAATDDPQLLDPLRGQQLFDALKGFDQNALNNQARQTIRGAISAKLRVFVVQAAPLEQLLPAVRQKKEGPVPDFVRRYVFGKDTKLAAHRAAWWTVPQVVKDTWPGVPRGRKTARPGFRTSCYQVWEVTAG